KRRRGSASKPSCVMSSCSFVLSRSRMTTFSPNCAGTVETRRSRSRERSSTRRRILIRPSCGSRFSEMSSLAMIFKREISRARGRRHDVVKDPVDAEADAELLLVRLDVDVRGARLQRLDEDQVGELDDRGGLGGLGQVDEVDLLALLPLDDVHVGAGLDARDL